MHPSGDPRRCDACTDAVAAFYLPVVVQLGERMIHATCGSCFVRLSGARPNERFRIASASSRTRASRAGDGRISDR
jgi:hypothetical protein